MDEAHALLARLRRIEELDRVRADRDELLAELRELLVEAEAWSRAEGGDAGALAVDRLRAALRATAVT